MAIRLIVAITAIPGKGSEPAQGYQPRCAEIKTEPGCEQSKAFQSVVNPDKLALLEHWTDQAALDAHTKLNSTRPPLLPELRIGTTEREDYEYNRTGSTLSQKLLTQSRFVSSFLCKRLGNPGFWFVFSWIPALACMCPLGCQALVNDPRKDSPACIEPSG